MQDNVIHLRSKILYEGYYRIQKMSPAGELVYDSGMFRNLITDNGLDSICDVPGGAFGIPFLFQRCYLGTGNAVPSVNDTELDAEVMEASSANDATTAFVEEEGNTPAYWRAVRVYTFAAADQNYNIQEIGTGFAGADLFSRALTVDPDTGNPLAITVLEGEIVIATYELRSYIDKTTHNGSMTISGEDYDLSWRPYQIATSIPFIHRGLRTGGENVGWRLIARPHYALNDVYTGFGGGSAQDQNYPTAPAYVPGSFEQTFTSFWPIGSANYASGIGIITIASNQAKWQVLFEPAIPKTADYTLSLTFTISWGRYTP